MSWQFENDKITYIKSKHLDYIENPNVYGINRLDLRANIFPSQKRNVFSKNKFDSEMIQSLNGDYRFLWLEKDTCDETVFEKEYDDSAWDTIDVPSMWQYRGYGFCTYPNIRYHFPFDPPRIRCENPVGIYRRTFMFDGKAEKCILHFSGVMSAFFVYINGVFAGFGKGSRNACEFDVTNLVTNGENVLAVKVYTWSDASYLENQDMLLANGIFRDVYLIKTKKTSVWDFLLTTDLENVYATVTLSDIQDNTTLKITCDGVTRELSAKTNTVSTKFKIENPKLWTAETPNLYDVYIELYKDGVLLEVHSKKVGLVVSEVIGNKFYVNKSPVMLKGVNRHEHNRKNGMAITYEQTAHELKMLKDFNINAIRCSHYTNDPTFYELASEYGFYVMDEADIESHGAEVTRDQGALAKMPEWEYAFLYRTQAMIQNNKNETCIVIWSIGNECGSGINIEKCAEYIRKSPVDRPIHQSQDCPTNPKFDDFRKNGYCTLASMSDEHYPASGKPVVLTEYAHGMGNAPGGLEDYWDYIYSHEQYCGGFVWEFKSHGFYAEDADGISYSKYGGDFDPDESNNWKNFTLDGYVKSDLTPKPSLYELKEAVSPVRINLVDGKIMCTNTNDFTDLSYLTLRWSILEDYTIIRSGEMKMPEIAARQSASIDIPIEIANPAPGAVYRADLKFFDGENMRSHRQIELPEKADKLKFEKNPFECSISAENDTITVKGENFEISFFNGLPSKYIKDGMVLFDAPMQFKFFRACTDNDYLPIRGYSPWEHCYTSSHNQKFTLDAVSVQKNSDNVCVTSSGKTTNLGLFSGFDWEMKYTVFADGLMLVSLHGIPFGMMPAELLRIGVCFELEKAFDKIQWYGRGENENYSDRKLSTPFGLYEKNINELNFRYEVPQESGTRTEISHLSVKSAGSSLNVIGSDRFIFSYHDVSLMDLRYAMHENELKESDKNYLYIDYASRGLGNASCGPEPEPAYKLPVHEFVFAFVLGANLDTQQVNQLSKLDFGEKTRKVTENFTPPTTEKIIQMFNCAIDD